MQKVHIVCNDRGVEKARRALAEGRYAEVTANCDEELANPSSTEAKEKALLLRASMKILTSQTSEAMSDLNLLIASSSDTKVFFIQPRLRH